MADDSVLTSFELHVQLKATYREPIEKDGRFSFSLPVHQYNKLRTPYVVNQRILAILFLPRDANEWLHHSEDGLITKRCALLGKSSKCTSERK